MSARDQLRRMGYDTDVVDGAIAVRGYGVATMVDPDDVAALQTFLDPVAHAERRFQHVAPEAANARARLRAAGYKVERVDATSDTFAVTPPPIGRTLPPPVVATPAQLVDQAAKL